MDRISDFSDKISTVTDAIGNLIGGEAFKDALGKAGSIGALISIGIGIYEQIKNDRQTEVERAFASLIKITFDSAQQSIPKGNEIPIRDAKNKNIKKELFEVFIKTEGWNSLPLILTCPEI